MRDQALAQAKVLGEEQRAGRIRGPLHGIPIGIKDNIDTAGVRTTAASAVFEDRVPAEDAEVVRRLKVAGAILIGKCNLHEFAQGGTSAISFFGPVRNPWKLERNAGGSSGGSAAAVATNCCYFALGTDTGGSIPDAGSLLRSRRFETDVRSREQSWHYPACLVTGSLRPARANSGRCRDRPTTDGRIRPFRYFERGSPGTELL